MSIEYHIPDITQIFFNLSYSLEISRSVERISTHQEEFN